MRRLQQMLFLSAALALGAGASFAQGNGNGSSCAALPSHGELRAALSAVVALGDAAVNGGLANDMWATVVNRDGVVCAVAFSGGDRGDQWPGSRAISAQKANTANAFSLPAGAGGVIPGLALSTANIFSAVQPGGSLFGLQHSNPVDTEVAYKGPASNFGGLNDPMVGERIGGVNVFGGGVGLYAEDGVLVGALGVSGDTSCTDHIISWKVRDTLGLDFVPAGVSATGDDNIIFDISDDAGLNPESASGFGHPLCGFGEEPIAADLPNSHPIGVNP
jgi:uncharacterized protein GlcG (DUF336 family)